MKRERKLTLLEAHALACEDAADRAWFEWVKAAVAGGVRCDVEPESLRELPTYDEEDKRWA